MIYNIIVCTVWNLIGFSLVNFLGYKNILLKLIVMLIWPIYILTFILGQSLSKIEELLDGNEF